MKVGSLFSGIGGMDAGLARAGHRHVFFAESDPWRREVLRARWPGVPVYDDVRTVARGGTERRGADAEPGRGRTDTAASAELRPVRRGEPDVAERQATVDLLCGGFPCQDLSVAGRRAGLAGSRSGLFHEFARIIDAFRPGWILVENVPGLLSSNGGRDFGIVLGTLADLGYGVAWRVLDSRFFGVPQRRRRVFIVGALVVGDPGAAAGRAGEVLAVGSRCPGHPAAGSQAGQDVAVASLSGLGSGGPDDNDAQGGRVIALDTYNQSVSEQTQTLRDPNGTFGDALPAVVAYALGSHAGSNGDASNASHASGGPVGMGISVEEIPALRSGRTQAIAASGVRRLTPRECERLQGLPDDWTRLDDKTPDSRRYSALGDAVTANVSHWIGERLNAVSPSTETGH